MNAESKNLYHKKWIKNLADLAYALQLPEGSYTVRSNKGGPAVLGEITLHSNWFYIMVGGTEITSVDRVLYRTCKSQKDFVGGYNRYCLTNMLTTPEFQNELRNWILHTPTKSS